MNTQTRYNLGYLQLLGFDKSEHILSSKRHFKVGCSQCEALVINGTATHETGCPNAVRECKGCNALIPMNRTWCEDCGL